MPTPVPLSAATEDYLETILNLSEEDGSTRVSAVAERLGIAKASVTQALATMRKAGLVAHEPYGRIYLTEHGRKQAMDVKRRHEALRDFLARVLGVAPDVADEEACRLEHAISPETLDRLLVFLERFESEARPPDRRPSAALPPGNRVKERS